MPELRMLNFSAGDLGRTTLHSAAGSREPCAQGLTSCQLLLGQRQPFCWRLGAGCKGASAGTASALLAGVASASAQDML